MKILGKIALAFAGMIVAMGSAIITTGVATPTIDRVEATVIEKIEQADGSCTLIFMADGDQLVIDEVPEVCRTLHEGDTVPY